MKYITTILLLLVFSIFTTPIKSQGRGGEEDPGEGNGCIIANAGLPMTITCNNSSIMIGTNYYNSNYSYVWSPSGSLNSPYLPKPFASPTQTTTYTLTAIPNGNLFLDPSFEEMDIYSGWIHQLGLQVGNWSHNSGYKYTSNPNQIRPQWVSTSPTNGNIMLAFDGPRNHHPYPIFSQTVNTNPNTSYMFSEQFLNLLNTNGYNDPTIRVKIVSYGSSGVRESSFDNILTFQNAEWHTLNIPWTSNSSEYAATLEIWSFPSTSLGDSIGNDFAVDNFSFSAGNCPMTSSTVTVYVDNKPSISPNGPIEWCYVFDGIRPLTLTSTPSSSYQWYKNGVAISGATQQSYTEQNLGWDPITFQPRNLIYTVANSCATSDPVTVVAKAFNNIVTHDAFYSGFNAVLFRINKDQMWDQNTFTYSYQFTNSGALVSETQNPSYVDLLTSVQNGTAFPATYRFTLNLQQFGCEVSEKYDITITGNDLPNIIHTPSISKKMPEKSIITTIIKESEQTPSSKVSIFPNPANRHVTINTKNKFLNIQLYSSTGELRRSFNKQGVQASIDVSWLPIGLYYLKIIYKNHSVTEKLFIMK